MYCAVMGTVSNKQINHMTQNLTG